MNQSSQAPHITLAQSTIGPRDRLEIQLQATAPASIAIIWPQHETVVSLQQWPQLLARTFRCLSNADVELRHHTARRKVRPQQDDFDEEREE
jgi:hypothetical protein